MMVMMIIMLKALRISHYLKDGGKDCFSLIRILSKQSKHAKILEIDELVNSINDNDKIINNMVTF